MDDLDTLTMPIDPNHIHDLVNLSEPSLSPDGTRVVFAWSNVNNERDRDQSRIMMLVLSDGSISPFTSGDRDTSPRFSPDGMAIAFLRADGDGMKQIWTIPAFGGEASKITGLPAGVSDHDWAPDSRRLTFVSDVNHESETDADKAQIVRVARRIRYRHDKGGWRGDSFHHVFTVDLKSRHINQLTYGEGDDRFPIWSPDGSKIAFISDRRVDRDFTWHSEAYVVSVDGGEPEMWSEGMYAVSAVTWSPDGHRLAVTGSDDAWVSDQRQGWVFVVGSDSAPIRLTDGIVTPAVPPAGSPVTEMRWTPDGQIIFVGDSRGQSYICSIPSSGGDLCRLTGGGVTYTAATLDGIADKMVVLSGSTDCPGDLYMVDIGSGTQSRLTSCNEEFLYRHGGSTQEKFTLRRLGEDIEYRVLLPPRFDEYTTYPMVVDIHGGPHGRFSDSFDMTHQTLATSGYVVLAINPRGSSSYGPEFLKAVVGDWGGEDYQDIMAVVEEMCSRRYVDQSRVGVHGYSYGGFMSSWAVGHTDLFEAAVVGAPCTNLSSMYGTSDIGVSFGEVQWGGMRRDALDLFLDHSPLTYVSNVDTPVLLLHGEDDLRCPIEQSEQYFVALKRLGKVAELVRFPGSSHGFRKSGHPRMREEYLSRMIDWFDRYLGVESV